LQRDIWTIRTDGTDPVRITNDAATDWSPVWSHDGNHLFFASDRGGTMNLWRVPIDEATGRVGGEPEAITTPAPYLAHIARSADGRRLAYTSFTNTRNVEVVAFDAVSGIVEGTPRAVTTGTQIWGFPDPSPDGHELVLQSYGRQQDIYVVRVDGSGLRQLTNDVEKDWNPTWSQDGKRIVFHADRSGGRLWVINPDGSGLRPLVEPDLSRRLLLWYAILSPDGQRLFANNANTGEAYIFPVGEQPSKAPIETLPPNTGPWTAPAWSSDGHRIVGSGAGTGLWIYDLRSKTYERITTDGGAASWLSDSRRLVYFRANPARCALLDTVSKQSADILTLPDLSTPCRVSGDDRNIFFTRATTAADIWLLTFRPGG
jgi:Tol biopolymer transport system component